jgi:hypothetical protein
MRGKVYFKKTIFVLVVNKKIKKTIIIKLRADVPILLFSTAKI